MTTMREKTIWAVAALGMFLGGQGGAAALEAARPAYKLPPVRALAPLTVKPVGALPPALAESKTEVAGTTELALAGREVLAQTTVHQAGATTKTASKPRVTTTSKGSVPSSIAPSRSCLPAKPTGSPAKPASSCPPKTTCGTKTASAPQTGCGVKSTGCSSGAKPSTPTASAATGVEMDEIARKTFERVNRERTSRGLAALVPHNGLNEVALRHGEDQAKHKNMSHTGSNGSTLADRFNASGDASVRNWSSIGEILALNYNVSDPVDTAVVGWLNSCGHRKLMLKADFVYAGLAVTRDADGVYYFTMVFMTE